MTTQTAKEIAIVNDALALLGHSTIHDFEGKTPASNICARLYALVLGQLISDYPWRFAMRQAQLTRITAAPVHKWKYAYQLPTDRDGTPRRFYRDLHGTPIADSEIYSDNVMTDEETVYCDYIKQGGLTGAFRNLLVRALAADLAISLMDDRGLRDRFHQDAYGPPSGGGKGGLWKTAASSDSAGSAPRSTMKIASGPLVDAHLGNGRSRWLAGQ